MEVRYCNLQYYNITFEVASTDGSEVEGGFPWPREDGRSPVDAVFPERPPGAGTFHNLKLRGESVEARRRPKRGTTLISTADNSTEDNAQRTVNVRRDSDLTK